MSGTENELALALLRMTEGRAERSGAVLEGLGVVCREDVNRPAGAKRWTVAIPGVTRGDGHTEREAAEALQANLRARADVTARLRWERRSTRWKGLARRLWREVADLQRQLREAEAALADDEPVGQPGGRMVRGKTDAETCRLSGWRVGDVLGGEECGRVERIVLTAIGKRLILAQRVGHPDDRENWTLSCRDWRRVPS